MNKSLIVLLVILLCSCNSGLNVIFENDSREDFKKMEAIVDSKVYIFENLKDSAETRPIKVSKSFRFFPIRVFTSSDTLEMGGDDSIPGKLIRSGNLYVRIEINNEYESGFKGLTIQSDLESELKRYKRQEMKRKKKLRNQHNR